MGRRSGGRRAPQMPNPSSRIRDRRRRTTRARESAIQMRTKLAESDVCPEDHGDRKSDAPERVEVVGRGPPSGRSPKREGRARQRRPSRRSRPAPGESPGEDVDAENVG